ncbi:hypothetical protein FB451DRAFT_1180886 [Mycena latifolia]|nr:hypothetical protein FB451DRAFT_1180886 [Mycena latifolia]
MCAELKRQQMIREHRFRHKTDGDGAEDLSGLFTGLELWSKSKDRQKTEKDEGGPSNRMQTGRPRAPINAKTRKGGEWAEGYGLDLHADHLQKPAAPVPQVTVSDWRVYHPFGRSRVGEHPLLSFTVRMLFSRLYRASSFLSSVLPPSHVLDVASSLLFVLSNVHLAEFQCQVWIHVVLLLRVQHYREYGQRDSLRYSEDDAPGINRHRSMGEPFTRAGDVLLPPSMFLRARRPCNLPAAYPGTISSEASTEFFRPSHFKSTGP